jgi:hypothetical protein
MKYDDMSWHHGGEYPADLPDDAAATHTGMFVAWAMLTGFAGACHLQEPQEGLVMLRQRIITPGVFFIRACDGKFTDEDVNEEGNAFTSSYFRFDAGSYLQDYEVHLVGNLPSLYQVADTWDNFEILRPVLDQRLANWRRAQGT